MPPINDPPPPRNFHPKTQALLDKLRAKQSGTTCKACDGKGTSSRGGQCYPCQGKGVLPC